MSIVELTAEMRAFVEASRERLQGILVPPLRSYLEVHAAEPEWLGAMLHNAGAGPDEAIRLSRLAATTDKDSLAREVARRLASGVVSTALMASLLPSALVTSTNQALLASLRDAVDGELDGD